MSRTWQEHAAAVAEVWARPRVGGFPPGTSLAFVAQVAYWHAVNLEGFEGSEVDWYAECRKQLPKSCTYDAPEEYDPGARSVMTHPPPAESQDATPKKGLQISEYVEPGVFIAQVDTSALEPAPPEPEPPPEPKVIKKTITIQSANPYGDDL